MNKKLIKRVAVASLAVLMTMPNITLTNTYSNTITSNVDETIEFIQQEIAKLKKALAENGDTYTEGRKKMLEKQIQNLEKNLEKQKGFKTDFEARKVQLEAENAQKAAEKAVADAANPYKRITLHGDAAVDEYLLQFKRHGSEI